MRFRPCIDIHNGKVKQIVGGSLKIGAGRQKELPYGSTSVPRSYRRDHLKGGHIILLNPPASPYYEETRKQALLALRAFPGGMQIGGGITDQNASGYLEAGASHVIVTSFVFQNGRLNRENLKNLCDAVGKERIVLDLSCRRRGGEYYIVTDRWQTFTEERLSETLLDELAGHCSEFLVRQGDGRKASGVEEELVRLLGRWGKIPVTYAGGIGTLEELEHFQNLCKGRLDFTIGSALDLFGGNIPYERAAQFHGKEL